MKEKVLVGMSGGVDSSVAVAVLQDEGYEPVGITMRLYDLPDGAEKNQGCCSLDDVNDAKRVASKLGIPHYTLNMKDAFKTHVVDYFADEYQIGRTPNPCIACNRVLKFEMLIDKAKQMGIYKVATGHYARIIKEENRLTIQRGVDLAKDQSYFLFDIPTKNLPNIIFPLGGLTKDETRIKARELNLRTAEKAESQEICFVPDDDYKSFLKKYGVDAKEGDFILDGKKIGRHSGIPFYTIGQRRGLGIGYSERLFVIDIKPRENLIYLGTEKELSKNSMRVTGTTFHLPYRDGEKLLAQIRYRTPPTAGIIKNEPDGSITFTFDEPVKAIAPGQATVFYRNNFIVGGGWIT